MKYDEFVNTLIVDDDHNICQTLKDILEIKLLRHIDTVHNLDSMYKRLKEKSYDLLFLDLNLPDGNGVDVLKPLMQEFPQTNVIVITGNSKLELAVECMQKGAVDFITKPLEFSKIIRSVTRALKHFDLVAENLRLRRQIMDSEGEPKRHFDGFLTLDERLVRSISYLNAISCSNQPIFLTGESGVGKTCLANMIHACSERAGPLYILNLAGQSENQIETKLFGSKDSGPAMVPMCRQGSLLIENIDLASDSLQRELLHFIEYEEYFQRGEDRPRFSSARLIFTSLLTEYDLAKTLRPDLLHRLLKRNVWIPPLRDRTDDILMHSKALIPALVRRYNLGRPHIPETIYTLLQNHPLPGNYNELQRLLDETFSKHSHSRVLSLDVIRGSLQRWNFKTTYHREKLSSNPFEEVNPLPNMKEASDFLVQEALKRTGGNQTAAGLMLGLTQQAVSRRLKLMKSD